MAKANILIVEDEAIIASVIAGALKKFEYEVVDILNTGEAAVTNALKKKPDLILMDIRLHGEIDGITATEQIQKKLDIPIIYLTAYADEPTLERAKKTKPYGYIPKPFQEIELKTTIEMALYKHGFELQLKESEARFRSLFENSQDVIYINDGSGKLLEMNPAGMSLFGFKREEIIGSQLDHLYVEPGERHAFLAELRKKKKMKDHLLRLRNKKGEAILGLVTANAMTDKDGEIIGIQGIIRDITKQKKLEEQMLQAAKMDSLGRLASGIAHDFNNYLTIINGYSELLLAEDEGGKDSENLKIILQAGKNASKLVAKILGFSRLQAPVPAIFDVNATLGELERIARRLLGEHTELCLDLDPNAGNITMDPGQFEQVLINLVLNARDAMPAGGKFSLASAHITLDENQAAEHPGLNPGNYTAIRVQDSGTGMEPEVLARIFEPFFSTKPTDEGTGLGLASVFGIITQNRGTVWAESEPGQGSTFHLLLPQTTTAPSPQSKHRPGHRFDGRTVLLIEDEQSIRQLLHAILESLGLAVREAADGMQGIKVAEEMPHLDLIFSDVVLPGLSGIEVAERIRKIHPETAVIFSSGQGENYLKRAGLDLTKVHFIAKPSSRKAIEEKIAAALG